jgi:hypothetical protein
MRLTVLTFLTAALLATPYGVTAQEGSPFDLRSGVAADAEADPSEPGEGTPADAAAAEAPEGRVVRQQPVGAGTADGVDDILTGSILRRTAAPAEDPYAALGIRAGGFILYPSVTVSTGYTTNAAGASGAAGSATATVTPEVAIRSDWARHAAALTLRGGYTGYFDGVTADRPSGSAEATGRLDMADGWSTDLAAGYAYEEQAISDADFPAGVDAPPGVHGLDASAALNGAAGPGLFTLAGSVRRTVYMDGFSGGAEVDQGDRTNTLHRARLRLGYRVTPGLAAFVEGEVSRRVYDRAVDNDGLMRSATGQAWRAGIMVERDPLLTGEIGLGVARADFDDPGLAGLQATTLDGSLAWSPTGLTTVTVNGATSLEPSADAVSSGSVAYDGSLDVAYAWRRNVTVNWTGGVRHQRYQGTGQIDTAYRAGVAATWKINRTVHLTGRYEHQWLVSSDPARDYQSDAVSAELRLQR